MFHLLHIVFWGGGWVVGLVSGTFLPTAGLLGETLLPGMAKEIAGRWKWFELNRTVM